MTQKQWSQDPFPKQGNRQERLAQLRQKSQSKKPAMPVVKPTKAKPRKQAPTVDPSQQAIADLRQQIDRLRKDNQSLSKRLRKAQRQQVDNLPNTPQKDARDAEIVKLEQSNGELTHQKLQLELDLSDLQTEMAQLRQQTLIAVSKQRLADRAHSHLTDERDHYRKQLEQAKLDNKNINDGARKQAQQIKQLQYALQKKQDEISNLNNTLQIRRVPSNKMLFDVASVLNTDNYTLFLTGLQRLVTAFTDVAGDGRRIFANRQPVTGLAEERDGDMWFVTDSIATRNIDSNRDLQDGMVYTALIGANKRAYIINEVTPEELPAERQRIQKRVKKVTNPSTDVVVYDELAGRHVIYISYLPNTFLAKRVTQSGGEFTHFDPNELSSTQYQAMLDSQKVDYIMLDTGHATHALFWATRDYLKTTDNRQRIQMFEHKPNPRILMEMVDYFSETVDNS